MAAQDYRTHNPSSCVICGHAGVRFLPKRQTPAHSVQDTHLCTRCYWGHRYFCGLSQIRLEGLPRVRKRAGNDLNDPEECVTGERLRMEVESLKRDYRDVIIEGAYVPRGRKLVKVRNLNEPIPDEA